MAEYRYYLIPDAMTRAFPEQFGKQTPTEFFDNIADLEKRYHQLREMPYNNERTWNERTRFPYARLVVGIDRQNPDGAVAIIQVRNGVNYLCDDYRGPYADRSDAQIPQMAKKLVEVIGVDRVRPHTYTQRDGYTWVQVEKDMHITEWLYAHELCSSLQFTRFLNRDGRELFQVRDGQRVIETNADGTKRLRAVKNIDVTHAYVGHYGCHIQQYAEDNFRIGCYVAPEHPQPGDNLDKLQVYQITKGGCEYRFMNYAYSKSRIHAADYSSVYIANLPADYDLDRCFQEFNAPEAYAAPTGKTVYVGTLYTPSNAAWQRFVVLNYTPVVLSGDSEIPGFETGGESVDKPWSASYERSESLDFSYTVNTDKIQRDTLEKVDGAGIEIAPILDGIPADIDGGSWTITPDGMQSVTTSGHTADDNYHLNGGDGSVTWTVHFSVSKSASQSGSITANSEQDADAQASAAQSAAQSACEGQVNGEIEAALSAAHNYFDNLKFSYNEVTVPHGFDAFGGDLGSSQTITVPANSSNDYLMKNDEWSVKVAIDKIDSETKQRIKGDTEFEIYEWDTVLQRYIPAGGYNQYAVERQADGAYKVINHSKDN